MRNLIFIFSIFATLNALATDALAEPKTASLKTTAAVENSVEKAQAQSKQSLNKSNSPSKEADSGNSAFAEKIQNAREARELKKQQSTAGSALSSPVGSVFKKTIYFFGGLLCLIGIFKKFRPSTRSLPNSKMINILARTSVNSRSSLLVVSVEGQRFILAQNSDELTLISALAESSPFSSQVEQAFTEATFQKVTQKTAVG